MEEFSGYKFFRQHKADTNRNVVPTILSAQQVHGLLLAVSKDPLVLMRRMLKGMKVDTRYGAYWAQPITTK